MFVKSYVQFSAPCSYFKYRIYVCLCIIKVNAFQPDTNSCTNISLNIFKNHNRGCIFTHRKAAQGNYVFIYLCVCCLPVYPHAHLYAGL